MVVGFRTCALVLLGVSLATLPGPAAGERSTRAATACPQQLLGAAYVQRVDRALRARQDLWGKALLGTTGGPTYAGAARYLKPLLRRVRRSGRR